MKTINTVVCGTGFVGRVHLEAVRRVGFVQLYGICDAVAERPRLWPKNFNARRSRISATSWRIPRWTPSTSARPTPSTFRWPRRRMEAGKHVICEKPLAISADQARGLVELAKAKNLANCTCHNLRYYPMVQHARRMREAGELGEILHVQGTYSQDWLLYDTDWNWRIDSKENGPSRCMADIGSHWCDMIEHITGLRITALCADLQTFHKTRKRPKGADRNLRRQDPEAGRLRGSADRHGRFRRRGAAPGRPRARRVHGQPGGLGPQEPALLGNLRHQGGRVVEPGASRRALDRPAQQQQPDHHQGSVAAAARGAPVSRICPAATAKATTTRSSRSSAASTRRWRTARRRWNIRNSPTACASSRSWRRNWRARRSTPGWKCRCPEPSGGRRLSLKLPLR